MSRDLGFQDLGSAISGCAVYDVQFSVSVSRIPIFGFPT